MKAVSVSELKAKLAQYLRLVKSGEEFDVQDRGVSVAVLPAASGMKVVSAAPPAKDASLLGQMKFSVKFHKSIDVVALLVAD